MSPVSDRWPRGLRRAQAAAYLGISASHFDKQRASGAIPAPRPLFGVEIYDKLDLDRLFGGHDMVADNDNDSYWDRAIARA